jgi:hypothetical protein
MKRFLVTHDAIIGRVDADNPRTQMQPMSLKFYTMVEADNLEAAQEQLVQYKDPGFITRIANTAEVGDTVTVDELFALLDQRKILLEQRP